MTMPKALMKSKHHYRFDSNGKREILHIGDWVYATHTSENFDPEGVRYGAMPLMSWKHWDEIEQWSLGRKSIRLDDTTVVFLDRDGNPLSI